MNTASKEFEMINYLSKTVGKTQQTMKEIECLKTIIEGLEINSVHKNETISIKLERRVGRDCQVFTIGMSKHLLNGIKKAITIEERNCFKQFKRTLRTYTRSVEV